MFILNYVDFNEYSKNDQPIYFYKVFQIFKQKIWSNPGWQKFFRYSGGTIIPDSRFVSVFCLPHLTVLLCFQFQMVLKIIAELASFLTKVKSKVNRSFSKWTVDKLNECGLRTYFSRIFHFLTHWLWVSSRTVYFHYFTLYHINYMLRNR